METRKELFDLLDAVERGREEELIVGKRFENQRLEKIRGEKIDFEDVEFYGCEFIECDFSGASFQKAVFVHCNLSGSVFSNTYWRNVRMEDCKAQGCRFFNSAMKSGALSKVYLDYSNFNHALWEDMRFEDVSFVSAFLSEMKVKKLSLDRCKFESTDFFKTPLKGVDFSLCDLINPLFSDDLREIKGVKMTAFQAADIAKMLGIIVTSV